LVLRKDKRLVAFEYEKSKEDVYQARVGESGKLSGRKLDLAVERNQIRRAFVYDGASFDESARRAGFDDGLSLVAEQAFRGHLGLRELKAGDRLRVIAQEVTVLGDFARYAGIEAIEIVRSGRDPQRIYYFSHPEEGGYFDANGRAPYEGGFRKPIPGAPVTSKFNMKRMHPVLKKVMPHTGTDFGAPSGTPIGSTSPGVVSFIGNGGPSGNLVKVKHDGGYESGYAHLSRFEAGLSVGDPVERLETVGYCGTTGRSTGPHLHFTMRKNGEYIDPESLNLDGLRVLGTAHRGAFADVRQKYDVILEAIVLPDVPPALLREPGQAVTGADMDLAVAGNDETAEGPLSHAEDAEVPPAAMTSPSPAAKSPSGKPANAVGTSSIVLTDADLLKMQEAVHDGEVTE
jgi:murein DD-endopeptidase MepM/ murein hydrolase activator NlpD